MACDQKAVNIWTARVIPVILLGIIGYASWAITEILGIHYLIHPPKDTDLLPRVSSAILILVIYYLLLLPVLACYARLLITIIINPGFVPYGPLWYAANNTRSHSHSTRSKSRGYRRGNATQREKPTQEDISDSSTLPEADIESGSTRTLALDVWQKDGIEFWQRDVFVCNYDGRPAWCNVCMNFKPDRAHHCSEVNRCVKKMDHFCPWVGGIVSETSLKFFIQFVGYTTLFTLHALVSMAVFLAEERRKTSTVDVHKVLTVALAGLFLLFSFGMTLSTLQMTMINVSTVENLSRKTKVWYLAVHIPRPDVGRRISENPKFLTITYPRPPEEQQILQQHGGYTPPNTTQQTLTSLQIPLPPLRTPSHYIEPRTFAILSTRQGENPFDLGPFENIQQVMGYTLLDWLLPIRSSPCANHTSSVSAFKMNDIVERLQEEVGL